MTLPDLPEPHVFEGAEDRRYVALAVETLVQDMSLDGDDEVARQLGGYTLGEEDAPTGVPEYVALEGDRIDLSNPPFVVGTIEVEGGEGGGETYRLTAGLDSERDLLIDPPVEVSFEGSLEEVVESFEQTLAQVYRTKGRYLEQVDAGVADPGVGSE